LRELMLADYAYMQGEIKAIYKQTSSHPDSNVLLTIAN
jgi:hypothetical protein